MLLWGFLIWCFGLSEALWNLLKLEFAFNFLRPTSTTSYQFSQLVLGAFLLIKQIICKYVWQVGSIQCPYSSFALKCQCKQISQKCNQQPQQKRKTGMLYSTSVLSANLSGKPLPILNTWKMKYWGVSCLNINGSNNKSVSCVFGIMMDNVVSCSTLGRSSSKCQFLHQF